MLNEFFKEAKLICLRKLLVSLSLKKLKVFLFKEAKVLRVSWLADDISLILFTSV